MPLVSAYPAAHPLTDGRQSDRALRVRRGVGVLLDEWGFAYAPEVPLPNRRRADIMALGRDGAIWIVEIKSSREDLLADSKWPDYREFCDRLFFATLADVPQALFPTDCGFIHTDGYGAEMLAEAPDHRLAAARRKAMTLRFARFAADKLATAERAANSGFQSS